MSKLLLLAVLFTTLLSACGRVNVPDSMSLNSTETEEEMILRAFEEEALKSGTIKTGVRLDPAALLRLFCQFYPSHSLCGRGQGNQASWCPYGTSSVPELDFLCMGGVYCKRMFGEQTGSCYPVGGFSPQPTTLYCPNIPGVGFGRKLFERWCPPGLTYCDYGGPHSGCRLVP